MNSDIETGLAALTEILEQCRSHDDVVNSCSCSSNNSDVVAGKAEWMPPSIVSKDNNQTNGGGTDKETTPRGFATSEGIEGEENEQKQREQDPENAWPALYTMARKHETALNATKHGNVAVLQCLRAILNNGAEDARLFMAGDDVGMTDVAPASFGVSQQQTLFSFSIAYDCSVLSFPGI